MPFPLSLSRILLFVVLVWSFDAKIGSAAAQNEIAPELLDRPPVAAPTSKIQSGAIPVILSASQEAENFVSGLMQGLMADSRVKARGIVIVKDDHVMLLRSAGTLAPDTRFDAGTLSDAFGAVAVMQMIEGGRLMPDADIAKALGETGTRGVTLAQILTFRAGEPSLLTRAVANASKTTWPNYLAKGIAQPLGMTATAFRGGKLETTLTDMSHLAIALVNGGAFQNGHILLPATVELMESTHFTRHPALPGAAYGFTEMRRNGWRALQHDGVADGVASRLVIVPEAKLGYVIIARGGNGSQFWRAADNGLFDKILPARNSQSPASTAAAPVQADAVRVAGAYEPVRDETAAVSPLKLGGRLRVRAGEGATLILTGAQSATLSPRPGGYWSNANGNLIAAALNGELVLSTGAYGPLALYKRPDLYAWLALLAAAATVGFFFYEHRRAPQLRFPSDPLLGLAGASVVFLLLSAFVWLLSPAV